MITQEELKQKLVYIPKTGLFYSVKDKLFATPYGSLNQSGYVNIKIAKKMYRAHRLAWLYMTGSMPKLFIDHINKVKNDNRFSNLREANASQNMMNRPAHSNNKIGLKGVCFHKSSQKWIAQIMINKKLNHIGSFDSPELASTAYQSFASKYHGEFYHE